MVRGVLLVLIGCGVLLFFSGGTAAGKGFPFRAGETLTYDIRWGPFSVGEAVLSARHGQGKTGESGYLFEFQAESSGFFSFMNRMNTRIISQTDGRITRSISYMKQKGESGRERKELVRFDWNRYVARKTPSGPDSRPVYLPCPVLDPLSMYYAFRIHPPGIGKSVSRRVCDGKKVMRTRIFVGKGKRISVGAGVFNTVRIEQDLAGLDGIFPVVQGHPVVIWVTADEFRIPIRISTTTPFGRLNVELSRMEGVDFSPENAREENQASQNEF
ncbi:MAG: DUF3108 domain-containing protein [Desulfovibrionales bacterium]